MAGVLMWLKETLIEPNKITIDATRTVDRSLVDAAKPHHRRAVELALNDVYGVRHESLFSFPPRLEGFVANRLLNDPRDLQLFRTLFQVTLWLALSSAVQLRYIDPHARAGYVLGWVHVAVTWGLFGQRFILAMHYSAHRPLFKLSLGWPAALANSFPQVVLANFFGMPSGAYYVHHCVMHHQSNNFFPYDVSSTMPYNRASPAHFVMYVMNFMLHTFLYLPYYAVRKGRYGVALVCTLCLSTYLVAFPLIYSYHPVYFLSSFGYSFLIGPFMLMLGNYSQHIFVDPDAPTSNYALACNHLNHPFNMCTFNDGYHITHHVSSITHWSDMPLHFIRNLDKYEGGNAIVFDGLNFMDLGLAVFRGDSGLRDLAKRVVQLRPDPLSEAELVAMMKRRLQPIETEETKLRPPQLGLFVLNQLMWLVAWAAGFPLAWMPALFIPFCHAGYLMM